MRRLKSENSQSVEGVAGVPKGSEGLVVGKISRSQIIFPFESEFEQSIIDEIVADSQVQRISSLVFPLPHCPPEEYVQLEFWVEEYMAPPKT